MKTSKGLTIVPTEKVFTKKQKAYFRTLFKLNPGNLTIFRTKAKRASNGTLIYEVHFMYNKVVPVFLGNVKFTTSGWKWHNFQKVS